MPRHVRKSIGHMSFELRREPALSDARLPADSHQSGLSIRQSRLKQALEPGELTITAEELCLQFTLPLQIPIWLDVAEGRPQPHWAGHAFELVLTGR